MLLQTGFLSMLFLRYIIDPICVFRQLPRTDLDLLVDRHQRVVHVLNLMFFRLNSFLSFVNKPSFLRIILFHRIEFTLIAFHTTLELLKLVLMLLNFDCGLLDLTLQVIDFP